MKTKDYLNILRNEIHSAVIATVDREGLPAARVVDIMLADENSVYFLTAKGKEFYHQLMEKNAVAVSGMCGGEGTMNKKAISIRGRVRNIGGNKLEEIFEQNPYMAEIYPQKESRMALEVFQIYEGTGEFFDLSVKPIRRESFPVGEQKEIPKEEAFGYYITDACTGCGACLEVCPQKCIDTDIAPFRIRRENCLHCGNCLTVCPAEAVREIPKRINAQRNINIRTDTNAPADINDQKKEEL